MPVKSRNGSAKPPANLDKLSQMLTLRSLETSLTKLSRAGQIRGSLHLATGQEACPIGAMSALNDSDTLTMTYRGHGYALAKGCSLDKIVAEVLGKEAGLCRGRGGKMHIVDLEHGVLGANGIVAGGIGTAAGAALAAKMDGNKRVSVTVFGDGTFNQGHAMEVFNIAALMNLPIIFFCENNLFAEMTPLSRSTKETDLSKKAAAFGLASEKIDGNDVDVVADKMEHWVRHVRSGKGPVFIEAMTYRTIGHYQNDPGTSYRDEAEIKAWQKKDPVARFVAKHKVSDQEFKLLQSRADTRVAEAVKWAQSLPDIEADLTSEAAFV